VQHHAQQWVVDLESIRVVDKSQSLDFCINKFTRDRVVPTIFASVSWEIGGTARTGLSCLRMGRTDPELKDRDCEQWRPLVVVFAPWTALMIRALRHPLVIAFAAWRLSGSQPIKL
jgi:hypothetical protein